MINLSWWALALIVIGAVLVTSGLIYIWLIWYWSRDRP